MYHNREDKVAYIMQTIGNKEPYLYFVDSLNTGVLTLNSFGLDHELFATKVADAFRQLNRNHAAHLIIDLRRNTGGFPENANHAFSYLAKDSFVQPKSLFVTTSEVPLQAYYQSTPAMTYESFFENRFDNSSRTPNGWRLQAPENDDSMVPARRGYDGEVYVLIGGDTFSAGTTFALNCKNQGITLIGEETGGGYYFHTGVYPVRYELPNSGIRFLLSLVRHENHVANETVSVGSGVRPDTRVPLTVDDLIEGKDPQLDYVLQKIADQTD